MKNGKAHELTVSYTVNGISYEKVVGALLTEFETIAQGDPVELRYKPDNPKKSVRPRELNPRNAQIVYIVGAALAVAGLPLFYMGRMW